MTKIQVKRIISLLMTAMILCTSIDVTTVKAANEVEMTEEQEQSVSSGDCMECLELEKSFDVDGICYTFHVTSQWEDAYNADIIIENKTECDVENWCISVPFSQEISNIWNAQIEEYEDGIYVIKNVGWNQDIKAGQSVAFGIMIKDKVVCIPEYYEMNSEKYKTGMDNYEVIYDVTAKWDGGFNGLITIWNKSDAVIEDWQVEFDFENEISDIWNGDIRSREDLHYVVKCLNYNQNINPGESTSIGFTVNGGNVEQLVSNVVLDEIGKSGHGNNGGTIGAEGEKEVVVAINEEEFFYNENIDRYVLNEKLEAISGTLTNIKNVKQLSYTITDVNNLTVDSGSINIEEQWRICEPGLVVGCNFLTVTAIGMAGEEYHAKLTLLNMSEENMANATVDMEDTDEDGNGISDGKEDFDKDGLNNYEEVLYESGIYLVDTDGDEISDYDEVKCYGTKPAIYDTDEDGMPDGREIELGLNPLESDSDANGIADGAEIINQTYTLEVENDKRREIKSVSVNLDCAGDINQSLYIMDIYDLDMRSTDVVGLVGVPVEIMSDVNFEKATITFSYDESLLGEINEDNLAIMWYDEENDNYIILDEETIIDKENHTVSYVTDHFSKWMVVDKEQWIACWEDSLVELTGQDEIPEKYTYREYYENSYDGVWLSDLKFSHEIGTNYPLFAFKYGEGSRTSSVPTIHEVPVSYINVFAFDVNYTGTGFKGVYNNTYNAHMDRYSHFWTVSSTPDGGTTSVCESVLYDSRDFKIGGAVSFSVYGPNSNFDEMEGKDISGIISAHTKYEANIPLFESYDAVVAYFMNGDESGVLNYDDIKNKDKISLVDGKEATFVNLSADVDIETDTDEDGIPDYFEVNGILRTSNGQKIYSDPNLTDTDADGITDFQEAGGLPTAENYKINGSNATYAVNHTESYGELPERFIYVDGRMNTNGEVYQGGIGYVPYLDVYYQGKYVNEEYFELFGESKRLTPTKVHNSCTSKWESMEDSEKEEYLTKFAVANFIALVIMTPQSQELYRIYLSGLGGENLGLGEGVTRQYIDCNYMFWANDRIGSNAAYISLMENMPQVVMAAQSVLSKDNKEICISINPEQSWQGFAYVEFMEHDLKGTLIESIGVVPFNYSGFGIFNSAIPAVTAYCTYDDQTEEYHMEYIYYIVDYYDFPGVFRIAEQDAIGIARSFELFGKCYGKYTWKKGDWATEFDFHN